MSRRREFSSDTTPLWVYAIGFVIVIGLLVWLGIPWWIHCFQVATDYWSK